MCMSGRHLGHQQAHNAEIVLRRPSEMQPRIENPTPL